MRNVLKAESVLRTFSYITLCHAIYLRLTVIDLTSLRLYVTVAPAEPIFPFTAKVNVDLPLLQR